MSAQAEIVPTLVERIKGSLVGLKMPRALEIVDATVRRIERGEVTALEAIDALLAEELTLRENRRVRTALVMARLSTIKTLAGFDFAFQPSLRSSRRSTRTASWPWPSWPSSSAAKSCTFSAHREPARATLLWPSASRP